MRPTEEYLRELTMIIFARKRIILGTMATFLAAAILISLFWPPTYTATGSVLVKNRQLTKNPQSIEETQIRIGEVDLTTMTTEMTLLTSNELIERTLAELNQDKKLDPGTVLSDEDLQERVEEIKQKLSATIVTGANIIEVNLKGKNPEVTQLILNALLENNIYFRTSIYNPEQTYDFYNKQASRFETDLQKINKEKYDLASTADSADPTLDIQNNLELRKTLQESLGLAIQEEMSLKADIHYLETQMQQPGIQFFSSIDNPAINQLSLNLQTVYFEKTTLLKIYTEGSEKIARVDQQIKKVYGTLKKEVVYYIDTLKNKKEILTKKINELQNSIDLLTKRNLELYKLKIEQERLLSQNTVLDRSYQVFATRTQEARISSSSKMESLFSLSIVEHPLVPVAPSFPKPRIVIPFGLLMGCLFGLCLAFFVEYFDYTFKNPGDTERYVGIKTLFSIPDWNGSVK